MYEDFYSLSGKPFQLSPDPAFFFGSKGHTSAFSYLKYGVYQGEGFLVITGEVGAGKTTLVRALLEELDVKTIVAAQIVSTQLEADDLLRSVAKAFGIRVPQDDKASLLAAIEAFLLMLFQQNKRALLIIDEAQNLNPGSIEELRMLSNFQCGDQALLQSFLVGQPELRNLMRSPAMEQFRQRVIASYHLGPLDEIETHGLHRAPPASGGVEGRSGVRPVGVSRRFRRHRRRSAPHQCHLQSADARGLPVRPASLQRLRRSPRSPPRSPARSVRRRW